MGFIFNYHIFECIAIKGFIFYKFIE